MRRRGLICACTLLAGLSAASLLAQRPDAFGHPLDHPAIAYTTQPASDAVARLNQDLRQGRVTLPFDPVNGYLRGVLAATHVPVESQLLVFSETSAQAEKISLANPRALFFGDDLAVGWVRGADALELAAVDPTQGVIFYTLEQKQNAAPQFARDNGCLLCHAIWETHGVPGLQTLSTFPTTDPKAYATGGFADQRTPFTERWGGWFVTGRGVPPHHLGNLPVVRPSISRQAQAPVLESVKGAFDLTGYPADTSDVVALLVLDHQASMTNLITWLGWEARVVAAGTQSSAGQERITFAAHELVDYLLFLDEAPLPRAVESTSGYAAQFAAHGAKDSRGRSLREFDLQTRLFKYRCSYMIDSDAFSALPPPAKQAVYARLSEVLSGRDGSTPYKALTREDRQAVAEILKDTHPDLPTTFGTVTR